MQIQEVYGGLDYHKNSVQACVLDRRGAERTNRRCPSDAAAVIAVLREAGDVQAVAIESSCGAAEFAEQIRAETGWTVRLAHPGYVNRMRANPDKTDHSDARLLADLTRVGYLPEVWLAPREVRELRSLIRLRQSTVAMRTATMQRANSLLRDRRIKRPPDVRLPWTKSWIQWIQHVPMSPNDRWFIDEVLTVFFLLNERIHRIEDRLRQISASDEMTAYLQTIKGVGEVTAWLLRAEIADINRFKNAKQLARFCGTSPRNSSSGDRIADSGLIRAGNPHLKAILIQAAHRLIMSDQRWRALADRLQSAGKPKSVIAAAVANRWVRWLYHRLREFRPSVA